MSNGSAPLAHAPERSATAGCAAGWYGTARSTFSGLRLHALFLEAPNNVRFVHNAAPPYHTLFRPFRYHPGAARSPLKPVETASGC